MYTHWQRDIASEVDGVKNTFSGWDQCMAKAYCKWPVVAGIIIGCLLALSIVWCLVRCLCCGVECCCGCASCMSCCTSCCRGNNHRNRGYTQPAPVAQFPQYTQYQPAPAPVYQPQFAQQQYAQPQYAHFDAPSNTRGQPKFNEDALPAMPSWDQSRSRQAEDVEMGHMGQAAPMLPKSAAMNVHEYPYQSHAGAYGGDISMSGLHTPQQEQYGYGQRSPSPYEGYGQAQPHQSRMQSPVSSVAPPPSYHTTAAPVARKPLAGSWRDL